VSIISGNTVPKQPDAAAEDAVDLSADRLRRFRQRKGRLNTAVGKPGSPDWPRCINCGEADIRCLEAHHLAGKPDTVMVVLCANCHCKLSDVQLDNPPWTNNTAAARRLHGLVDLLRLVALGFEDE